MGCCGGAEPTADNVPDPHVKFNKKRGCTDVFCLIIFIAFAAGLGYIAFLSMTVGDPYSVLYGKDYLGHRCGVGTMASKPKIFYPRVDKDMLAQPAIVTTGMWWRLQLYGLCLSECPSNSTLACAADPASCKVDDYGTAAERDSADYWAVVPTVDLLNRCIPHDPAAATKAPSRCAFPQCNGQNFAPCDTEYPTMWVATFPKSLQCEVFLEASTTEQLNARGSSALEKMLGQYIGIGMRVVSSITAATGVILGTGVALPIVTGFAWLILLRLFAGIFIWVILLAVGVGLYVLSLYLWLKSGLVATALAALTTANITQTVDGAPGEVLSAGNATLYAAIGAITSAQDAIVAIAPDELTAALNSANNETPWLWIVLAALVTIVTLFYTIWICASQKAIRTAIALVKQGTMVIKDRPLSMFFPFNTLTLQLLNALFFVLLFLFLRTAALDMSHFSGATDLVTSASTFASEMKWYDANAADLANIDGASTYLNIGLYIYVLFGFLWINATITNVAWTALSGSVSHWYFFREDDRAKTGTPLLKSLGRVMLYHLGSVLFGSFIVALVQLMRILLALLDKHTKGLQDKNLLLKIVIKCVACCLWCFEKTLKWLTGYCYIYVAMQGCGFCKAAFMTFALIVSNPNQLAINTFVRSMLGLVQILGVPVLCGWLCNLWLVSSGVAETIWPTLVVVVTGYIVAQAFATVFACTLDTLFVCCCRDKAEYQGKFMPNGLRSAFGFGKKGKGEGGESKEDKADQEADAVAMS